jgi:hypothetical protein
MKLPAISLAFSGLLIISYFGSFYSICSFGKIIASEPA